MTAETADHDVQVAVVGGGPAGLTAAMYTTRLGLDTVLIDRGGGRAAMMQETHNVIGVTEDVSGMEFLGTALEQVTAYGATHVRATIEEATHSDDGRLRLEGGDTTVLADRVVLATGFADGRPDPPVPRTGRGPHYCLHCDAYMFVDAPVYVMGTGNSAAVVAMIMLNYTDDVDLLLNGDEPTWDDEIGAQLRAHPVDVIDAEVTEVHNDDEGWLESIGFADGTQRDYRGGFAMYGSTYNTDLAEQLGCALTADGTVEVDDHGQTSVEGVYAVGDVTPGHNQIPVAMGDGAKAGIDIYYDLRTFPLSLEEIEARGGIEADDVPGLSPSLREHARQHPSNVGVPDASTADD
jgi:thioredoxin reductase (NADPH)